MDGCPAGYEGIYDADLCEAASVALSLTYDSSENDGIDTALCNWCGGCNPTTVRLSDSHGELAQWLCVVSGGTCQLLLSRVTVDGNIHALYTISCGNVLPHPLSPTCRYLENHVFLS